MGLLWMNLLLVFIFSLLARYYAKPVYRKEFAIPIRPNPYLVFGALTSLVTIAGLRSNIGDTYSYKYAYEFNDYTWELILSEKDKGFGVLQMLLQNYVSDDPQILIFVTALLTNALIVFVLYKYSRMIEISLYVYITGGLFLVSMNGIRQVLAAAIAFTAIHFLIKRNWLGYTLIIILASFFHQSALILLPIYFIVRLKEWSKMTAIMLTAAVLIVLGYELFSELLFQAIEDTQYGHYRTFSEGGANKLRVVVAGVPLLIAFIGRKKFREISPHTNVIVNMSLLGFFFLLISTQNWIFARFSIYFELYQLILISWIIKLFREKDGKLIYLGILVCYFIFYYYDSVIALNIMYLSDYLNW
ncbi:MAG TPA: EpsG family protein [Virgibacillus sp.]|nr:EpsG family protein [Virgibacillus sp.]